MKKIILKIFVLALFIYSCENKEPTEPDYDPDAVRVAGKYIATKFILPGSYDSSVDVLANGGYINLELYLDFTVKGYWSVPAHPDLQGSGFEEQLAGKYTVSNDSLQFKDMKNILSHPQYFFIIKDDSLELNLEGISPLIIVLESIK